MHLIKSIYRVLRGVLFTAIIVVAVIYLALYVFLSVPVCQNAIRVKLEKEVSRFLDTDVKIGAVIIKPFNEVTINGLEVFEKDGSRCIKVETLGAGIGLWRLIKEQHIELTYAEIIGLEAHIGKKYKDSPLNIQFIIDAFKPKDNNKPPARFDINLRNVVIRRSVVTYDNEWMPKTGRPGKTDFNHLRMWDLKADLNLPKIANDDFIIDVRRLAFKLSGGLDVEKVAFRSYITDKSLSLTNFLVQLPQTQLRISDLSIEYDGFGNIMQSISSGTKKVLVTADPLVASDFAWLLPELRLYPDSLLFNLETKGNINNLDSVSLNLYNKDKSLALNLKGSVENLQDKELLELHLQEMKFNITSFLIREIQERILKKEEKWQAILKDAGNVSVTASGNYVPAKGNADLKSKVVTTCGEIDLTAKSVGVKNGKGRLEAVAILDNLETGQLIGYRPLESLTGEISFEGNIEGRDIDGTLEASLDELIFRNYRLKDITADITKVKKEINLSLESANSSARFNVDLTASLDSKDRWGELHAGIDALELDILAAMPEKYRGFVMTGRIDADLAGTSVEDVEGEVRLTDFIFHNSTRKPVKLDHFLLKAESDTARRFITIDSDWVNGTLKGDFKFANLAGELKGMMTKVLPCLINSSGETEGFNSDLNFNFTITPDNTLPEFFNLPFRFLVPVPIKGSVDAESNLASLSVEAPYLQQGKNKLLRNINLEASLDAESGTLELKGGGITPVKKGEMKVDLQVFGQDDNIFSDISWSTLGKSSFNGAVSLGAAISRNELTSSPEVVLDLNPTVFDFGNARWNIGRASMAYKNKTLSVDGLKIWHDNQFVKIDGTASSSPLDSLKVSLASIDVGYIFDLLDIRYVTFAGSATGDVEASGAMSRNPVAQTNNLEIKDFSYNGTVFGDAKFTSSWLNDSKKVAIRADISDADNYKTVIDGGIWVTRDSLSFDLDTERIPLGFVQPFMSAFASDVNGYASGKAKLFGTFKDIDLTGRLKADPVSLKLDYTNVVYHGSDSVIFEPGRIIIPSFRIYDKEGQSALFSGELTHDYFHDASFTFRMSDARRLLCFDTNAQINPDWYGTIYGNGGALVKGLPGSVSVSVDMSMVGNSSFTFVLNDRQAAEDYKFLTFSDRRKEEAEKLKTDTISDILKNFSKKINVQDDDPSRFSMDIRASVTPSTLMTLLMDPVAGDKITARGNGNIQVDYDTESDAMKMFGKYILEEGNYNFSLQDLILRDFSISRGSSIAFNGDPLNAVLDITASYRVNTNLSDLDKSFSTDRDLARTNVPVDAMLMVNGPMQQPDITFDIQLPTLTQDVERKVKSIISTDDMMSRQIIYLLALNRFYTPEYMGSSSNGGELASVASSTLSSQLSNMFGQLTNKFSLSPSFRSDKGDFSDLEVDVALTSRLLNNRLIINGNFGYRDKSTSQTTFIGDFDIEYLLRRGGNLRLKAYNHFNDQNYYLRQALTTQGLGVIYRKDFDNPFAKFRKRKPEKDEKSDAEGSEKNTNEPGSNADGNASLKEESVGSGKNME